MSNGIIGRKLGMTSVFAKDGQYVPVTVVEAGPCMITQVKTVATDGYNALQLGFQEKPLKRVNKPQTGHLKKIGSSRGFAILKEFSADNPADFQCGQELTVNLFETGEKVAVTGTSKGRGFSGVIKRHGFSGGAKTHGSRNQRLPGAIGQMSWPARVIPGKKMPGRYGNRRKTVKNLEIFDIREKDNLLLIKGAVPGSANGFVQIKKIAKPA